MTEPDHNTSTPTSPPTGAAEQPAVSQAAELVPTGKLAKAAKIATQVQQAREAAGLAHDLLSDPGQAVEDAKNLAKEAAGAKVKQEAVKQLLKTKPGQAVAKAIQAAKARATQAAETAAKRLAERLSVQALRAGITAVGAAVLDLVGWPVLAAIGAFLLIAIVVIVALNASSPSSAEPVTRSAFQPVGDATTKQELSAILNSQPSTNLRDATQLNRYILPKSDLDQLKICQDSSGQCKIDRRVIHLLSLLGNQFGQVRASIIDEYDPNASPPDPNRIFSREEDPGKFPLISAHTTGQAVDIYSVGFVRRSGWQVLIPLELNWARSNATSFATTGDFIFQPLASSLKPKSVQTVAQNDLSKLYASANDAFQSLLPGSEVVGPADFDRFNQAWLAFSTELQARRDAAAQKAAFSAITPMKNQSQDAEWTAFWIGVHSTFAGIDDFAYEARDNSQGRLQLFPILSLGQKIIDQVVKADQANNARDLKDALSQLNSLEHQLDGLVPPYLAGSRSDFGKALLDLQSLQKLQHLKEAVAAANQGNPSSLIDDLDSLQSLDQLEQLNQLQTGASLPNTHDLASLDNLKYLGFLAELAKLNHGQLDRLANDRNNNQAVQLAASLGNLGKLGQLSNLASLGKSYPSLQNELGPLQSLSGLSVLSQLEDDFASQNNDWQNWQFAQLSTLGGSNTIDLAKPLLAQIDDKSSFGLATLGLLADPPTAFGIKDIAFPALPNNLDLTTIGNDSLAPLQNWGRSGLFKPGPMTDTSEIAQRLNDNQKIQTNVDRILSSEAAQARQRQIDIVANSLFYRPAAETATHKLVHFALNLPAETRPNQILGIYKEGTYEGDAVSGSIYSQAVIDHVHFGY